MSHDYVEPASIDEAVELLERHGDEAHLIGGGASLVLMLRQGLVAPSLLVGLRRIPDLRGIRPSADGGLEIGAMTTHRSIERAPAVRDHAAALAEAFGHVATVRIRNQGTIGGNLAHADPAQDPPPILMALDAVVVARGPAGERLIPMAELFVDYFETVLAADEVITAVRLPPRGPGSTAAYLKFLPGSKDDYATVAIAASGSLVDGRWSEVRIACGALATVPLRVTAAEAVLEGSAMDDSEIERAAALVGDGVDPIDDVRGSADYKREMAVVWARRALRRLASRDRATNGARP